MRAALPVRLEAHLDESRLLQPGDAVLVALSGGRDSVVLLNPEGGRVTSRRART